MRSIVRTVGLAIVFGFAVLPVASCGTGSANHRPVIVSVYPPPDTQLDNVVDEFLLRYDAPVRILDPYAVSGADARGTYPMLPSLDPDDPTLIRVRRDPSVYLVPGPFQLRVGAGLEANAEGHYRLEDDWFTYGFGSGSNLFVASRARSAVVELDPTSFTELGVTATPGGRAPIGLEGTEVGSTVRVWTELDSGGGDGHALAWFAPGDASMTTIALTTGGGDLVTARSTIALGREHDRVYAAFRDEALGQVRVAAVDTTTGVEVGSVVLSPPAGPATAPVGIALGSAGNLLFVTCTTATEDLFCAIDIPTFLETDLGPGPGVDGLPVPNGVGAIATWSTLAFVANLPSPTASLSAVQAATRLIYGESPSTIPGRPEDVLVTPDGLWLLEGLSGFTGGHALVRRTRNYVLDPTPLEVSTETAGANPAPTALVALATYRTGPRFLALFDNDTLATWLWDLNDVYQQDLDATLPGVQAADLSVVAPDPTAATFVAGITPP